MAGQGSLERGLECLARRSWADADQHLTEAREADELAAWVLEQLAVARLLIGRQEASEESWIEAHESFLRDGDTRGAARCAFWLGLLLVMRDIAADTHSLRAAITGAYAYARAHGWAGRPDG